MKKVTIVFPSPKEMWEFFKLSDIKEFRLDSSNCSVTGKFSESDIELAQEQMNAIVQKPESD